MIYVPCFLIFITVRYNISRITFMFPSIKSIRIVVANIGLPSTTCVSYLLWMCFCHLTHKPKNELSIPMGLMVSFLVLLVGSLGLGSVSPDIYLVIPCFLIGYLSLVDLNASSPIVFDNEKKTIKNFLPNQTVLFSYKLGTISFHLFKQQTDHIFLSSKGIDKVRYNC